VKHVTVGLHGLREAFVGAWPYGGGVLRPREAPGGLYDVLKAEVADRVTLRVEAGEVGNIVRGRSRPMEYARALFDFADARPYDEIYSEFVEPLRDFVALATRRQSYVTSVSLSATADDGPFWQLAGLPYPRPDTRGTQPVRALAVDLSKVDDLQGMLRRWFRLRERVGAVWTTFFAALYGAAVLEDQFLSLAAFAEGYHRALHDQPPLTKAVAKRATAAMLNALDDPPLRALFRARLNHANAQTQRERLSELARRAAESVGWPIDEKDAVAEVIDTRNWMVHWGRRGKHAVEDPADIVRLVRRLELIVHVNLLRDVGLSDDALRDGVGSGWRFEGLP
jgi:hypothetical protein